MLELRLAGHGPRPVPAGRLVNTWNDDAGVAFARAYVHGSLRSIEWPGVGIFEFTAASPAVLLHATTTDVARAHDIFRRIVQPIVLQAQGAEVLHASAVAGPGGALVFAGVSGQGKSTIAWTLGRRHGFGQLADDAVVIGGLDAGTEAAGICVIPLPYVPRLRPLARGVLTPGDAPASAAVEARGDRPPLGAIVLLEQSDGAAALPHPARLRPTDAFTAVLAHAYCFDEHDRTERERMVQHYFAVAAGVPVFRLQYRPDFAALDALVDTIVSCTAAAHQTRG